MHFINAKLKSEKGEVIAASLEGNITLPKRETENRWGGVFEMSIHEAMKLLNKTDGNFELDIPGVLKGKIILKNANGDFLGSGNPVIYPTNN